MKQLTMTKVLTPLAALAFAFGVQAAAVSTETFDTYTAGTTVISNQTGWSFTYSTDGADDASAVTAYDNNTPSELPYGVSTAGANYLKLSTEDGTLFRSMDGDNGAAIQLNTGVFVDTDVQFTVTDVSDRPTPDSGDKLVIWLEANGNATNLCVLGHSFGASTSDRTDKVYTLVPTAGGTLSITPGDWYRLTVKAVSSFSLADESVSYPAFQVYLDGAELKAYEYIGDATTLGIGQITDYQPYIPARTATMTELTKVGFSGEGALDSVVVTRETVVGTASELTFTWSSEAITSVSLPTVGATITSSGDTFRVAQSSTPLQIVLNGSNLANYNVTIDGVAYDPESTNTIVPNQSKTINIVATAKDTVNVTFALNRDKWTEGDPALWTYISSIMVGDEDITSDLIAGDPVPISLKVGTNVTVAVNLTSPVAAATLSPAGATELTVSGFNIAVDAFGDGAAEITIGATTPGATMGNVAYATFADALDAAKAAHSGSIKLGANPAAGTFAIGASDDITIDLAGNTITGADGSAVFTVAAGGTLTITNTDSSVGAVIADADDPCISNSGTLNLQAGKFSGAISGGTINVTGGYYSAGIAGATIAPGYELRENTSPTYVGYTYELFPLIVISFNANDGTGTMAAQAVNYNTATNLNANTFTYEGHTFAGWATAADGEVVYTDGGNITVTGDTTLYAKWTLNTVMVTFNANYGETPATSSQTVNYGEATALTANAFSRTGYRFDGWATSVDGEVAYADQANITATAPITLYAKWTVQTFTVTFNKNDNDATGTMSDQTFTYNVPQALTSNVFAKADYTFAGWATASDGEVAYADGASVTLTSAGLTLYAKWTQNAPVTPTIPEGQSSVEKAGDGTENAADVAASVEVAKPAAASSVDNVTYQAYFTKTATYDSESGKWTVTAKIAETVEQNAATTAAAIVDGTSESSEVTVPAGLYYKVTTMTGLDGTGASSKSGLSTGAVEVTKPGTTQGFIKVQIGTAPFAN